MNETHTERYGDVTEVPVTALASIGDFITHEWGENYLAGYIGRHTNTVMDRIVYVFQVKASDGSRFAVGTTRYGDPFELKGRAWLAFLQSRGIEAHVRDVTSR